MFREPLRAVRPRGMTEQSKNNFTEKFVGIVHANADKALTLTFSVNPEVEFRVVSAAFPVGQLAQSAAEVPAVLDPVVRPIGQIHVGSLPVALHHRIAYQTV